MLTLVPVSIRPPQLPVSSVSVGVGPVGALKVGGSPSEPPPHAATVTRSRAKRAPNEPDMATVALKGPSLRAPYYSEVCDAQGVSVELAAARCMTRMYSACYDEIDPTRGGLAVAAARWMIVELAYPATAVWVSAVGP